MTNGKRFVIPNSDGTKGASLKFVEVVADQGRKPEPANHVSGGTNQAHRRSQIGPRTPTRSAMKNTVTTDAQTWTLDAARQYCQRLALAHYENFTVGSRLIPRDKLQHIYAIYAYCRTVDDLGDEAAATPGEPAPDLDTTSLLAARMPASLEYLADDVPAYRLALLDLWQEELECCYSGRPTHPVMVALRESVKVFDLPQEPFLKLIEANRMDQRVQRYPTFQDLLHYCSHSANPVGHLFLYLFGYRDKERQRMSDATCSALQLTNFWQDVARDFRKGRIYLPLEDMDRFGYTEDELARGECTPAFQQLMSFEAGRALDLFQQGAPLVATLDGVAKLDVALFTRGGVAVLEAIQKQRYDVLTRRPSLSRSRKAGLFLSTWLSWKMGLGFRLPKAHRAP